MQHLGFDFFIYKLVTSYLYNDFLYSEVLVILSKGFFAKLTAVGKVKKPMINHAISFLIIKRRKLDNFFISHYVEKYR